MVAITSYCIQQKAVAVACVVRPSFYAVSVTRTLAQHPAAASVIVMLRALLRGRKARAVLAAACALCARRGGGVHQYSISGRGSGECARRRGVCWRICGWRGAIKAHGWHGCCCNGRGRRL